MRWITTLILVFLFTASVMAGEKAQQIQLLEQQLKTLEWEAKWLDERLNAIFPKSLQDEILKLQKRVKIIQIEWPKVKARIEKLKTYKVDATKPPK